jgi:hypothetical protein
MKKKTQIIDPIPISIIKDEIVKLTPLGITNYADNEIYITDAFISPYIMKEIGRLRETSFRKMGAGSGKSQDIDEYDVMENPFKQLFIWDPENGEITGAYRFIFMKNLTNGGPTEHLFFFTDEFLSKKEFIIELGRSFVNFDAKKYRYALKNLWDGLGYLMYTYPEIEYFFGKVTMYPWLLKLKLPVLLEFLEEFFPSDGSVLPKNPFLFEKQQLFSKKMGYLLGKRKIRDIFKTGIPTQFPPLLNSYMGLTETMNFFGATVNVRFGKVIEGAIMLRIPDVKEKIKNEHMAPFIKSE